MKITFCAPLYIWCDSVLGTCLSIHLLPIVMLTARPTLHERFTFTTHTHLPHLRVLLPVLDTRQLSFKTFELNRSFSSRRMVRLCRISITFQLHGSGNYQAFSDTILTRHRFILRPSGPNLINSFRGIIYPVRQLCVASAFAFPSNCKFWFLKLIVDNLLHFKGYGTTFQISDVCVNAFVQCIFQFHWLQERKTGTEHTRRCKNVNFKPWYCPVYKGSRLGHTWIRVSKKEDDNILVRLPRASTFQTRCLRDVCTGNVMPNVPSTATWTRNGASSFHFRSFSSPPLPSQGLLLFSEVFQFL